MIHEVSEFNAFTSAVGGPSKPPRWAADPVAFAVYLRFGATDGDITATHQAQTFTHRDRHVTPAPSGSPCHFLTDPPQICVPGATQTSAVNKTPRMHASVPAELQPWRLLPRLQRVIPGRFPLASLTSAATPAVSRCGCCGQTASTGRVFVCLMRVFVSPGLFSIRPLDKCEHRSWMLKLHLLLCCDTGDFFWITNKLDPVTEVSDVGVIPRARKLKLKLCLTAWLVFQVLGFDVSC